MNHIMLELEQAAAHVHLAPQTLKHAAQRGEVAAQVRQDGSWYFDHVALDEWAQRQLLASSDRELAEQHRVIMDEQRRADRLNWGVADYLTAETVELALAAKAKGGVIRDLADLADRSGYVYDPDALYRELVAREEVASTAIGEGVALLHPRLHDPYIFSESFVVYARALRPVYFGAPDGEATRHFFLICSTDHEEHLHILARLAMLAHGTELIERLDAAEDAATVLSVIRECEEEFRS